MIIHVDMDAFYASVEERDNPELVGQPVVVGGSPESRGVVAAANYVAREYGIHSAMPMSTAIKHCATAIRIPVRMDRYHEVSRQLRTIFNSYTPLVEPLALDEAFLDVSGCEALFGSAEVIAVEIKNRIRAELQLVASVGVAPNKFLAKLASDLEKPDGFVLVSTDNVQEFLDPLPVSRIWGVGKVTGAAFERLGLHTIGQLREIDSQQLEQRFGKMGQHVLALAHGIDDRPVVPDRAAKSISNETTFPRDICDAEILRSWLMDLTEQVAGRLRRSNLYARTVQLKIRYEDFQTYTRRVTLDDPTDVTRQIWDAAQSLLDNRLPERPIQVRLLGVGVSGLLEARPRQAGLFEDDHEQQGRRLDAATDMIKERFGSDAVRRGLTGHDQSSGDGSNE
jgi:DNA polymerase-4